MISLEIIIACIVLASIGTVLETKLKEREDHE